MALEGGAEAQGLKVKMEDMNAAWDDIQNKSRQKQDMLEDGLREVCNNTPDFFLSVVCSALFRSPPPTTTIIPIPSFGCERLLGAVKYSRFGGWMPSARPTFCLVGLQSSDGREKERVCVCVCTLA